MGFGYCSFSAGFSDGSFVLFFFLNMDIRYKTFQMVQSITSLSKFDSVTSSPGLVVIDYFAFWCSPCLQIAPKIDELASIHTNVKFYKVDIDEASDIATREGISAMPTFHFYLDGKYVDKVVGANLPAIKKKVAQYA